jgi:hypothetical protein
MTTHHQSLNIATTSPVKWTVANNLLTKCLDHLGPEVGAVSYSSIVLPDDDTRDGYLLFDALDIIIEAGNIDYGRAREIIEALKRNSLFIEQR